MTGIVDLGRYITQRRRMYFRDFIKYWRSFFSRSRGPTKFVILCWRRTGSNWLCGLLYRHSEIFMHNELFNETSIHTYYQGSKEEWTFAKRDLMPQQFLEEMYEAYKTYGHNTSTKAVGFKSFPEHYWDHGHPNCSLQQTFDTLMDNIEVRKVILYRENAIAVFISMVRSKITGNYLTRNYDNIKLSVNISEMQRFIDRYTHTYKHYNEITSGQHRYHIKYEDMLDKDLISDILKDLQKFLGVAYEELTPLVETVPQSSGDIESAIENYDAVEFAWRHTNLNKYLPRSKVSSGTMTPTPISSKEHLPLYNEQQSPAEHIWGLLIPIRSYNNNIDACTDMLGQLYESIMNTTLVSDRKLIHIIFGIDENDIIYDSEKGKNLLTEIFSEFSDNISIIILKNLSGKLCKIWNILAKHAYDQGCAFTVLLGDDVRLITPDWKHAIERHFLDISVERSLPFGAACVAFRDQSFPGFPTFPVIHSSHMNSFNTLLPNALINQGGDPFLFALYRRFDAAVFADDIYLNNTIGGKDAARYLKQPVRWNNEFLSTSIRTLCDTLSLSTTVPCVDVVIPTYRCDVTVLRHIISLRASVEAMVSFWIIVDNPTSPHVEAVRQLETVSRNYQVNVRVHHGNFGASAARNTGLDYSDADWVILLDDDVTPEEHLLDAYLGATMRFPDAAVLVGSTHLPAVRNLVTAAMVACDLTGSYVIAERRRDPPWGVTANICVKGRTSRIRFQLEYPKTGGGEDIDYCVRAAKGGGQIVAVPGALASHPWWDEGKVSCIRHIMGWAQGESLCVSSKTLREHVFLTAPNGIESCLLLLVIQTVLLVLYPHRAAEYMLPCVCSVIAIMAIELAWHTSHVYRRTWKHFKEHTTGFKCIITVCGAAFVILQESARCISHIKRGAVCNIFWRFDWLCGKNPVYIQSLKNYLLTKALIFVFVVMFFYDAHFIALDRIKLIYFVLTDNYPQRQCLK